MSEQVIWIPLPDGRRLHARVWRPDGAEPVGVVLSYDPYPNQWMTRAVDAPHGRALAEAGLAYARVALAGSGDSDGLLHDEYLASELQDGVDVIAWFAEQPWCNGRVGMRGLSWGGFNALQVAALRPPSLAAVVSACSTDDRYVDDVHYMGGSVLGSDMQLWATWAHLFFVAPPDPDVVGPSWRERWIERLDAVEPVIGTWLDHQRRDAYWQHGSVGVEPDAVTVPLLLVGGWEDGYRDAILRLLAARPERTWAVIGPWGHGWPHRAGPGPRLETWVGREVRWWQHWLLGVDRHVELDPQVQVFVQDARRPGEHLADRTGQWMSFPPELVEATHRMFTGKPGATLVVRRQAVQGMHGPVWCPDGDRADFTLDQRSEDAASATCEWPVDRDLPIVGRVVVRLRVTADAPAALVAVRLCDVAPDGASTLVAMGARNLAGHASDDVVVGLRATGYVVPAGHVLRLSVTPGYWPMLWPSARVTTLTIDPGHCVVEVPVLAMPPPNPRTWAPPVAEPARPPDQAPGRWVEQVFGSDRVTMHRVTDSGVQTLDDGAWWRVGGRTTWETSDDPLDTRTVTVATMERGRGAWHVTWEATSTMEADEEWFHVRVDVAATSTGETVFERGYRHDIRRDHC